MERKLLRTLQQLQEEELELRTDADRYDACVLQQVRVLIALEILRGGDSAMEDL